MDFANCKMLSEFIIPHFAESIVRSRGHVSGPVSAHVGTPVPQNFSVDLEFVVHSNYTTLKTCVNMISTENLIVSNTDEN
jgi:hypothetical protein